MENIPPTQPPRSMSRYVLTALAAILVLTAFVLVGLNAYMQQKQMGSVTQYLPSLSGDSSQTYQNGYREGYAAARKKYQSLFPMIGAGSQTLVGAIASVSGNTLTVTQENLDTDPVIDGVSDSRTITITDKTQITRQTPKAPDVFQKEMQQFKPSMKPGSPPPMPPTPFTTETIKLSDLAVGDRVNIVAASDIRLAPSFEAVQIILNTQPSAQPVLPPPAATTPEPTPTAAPTQPTSTP